MTRNSQILVWVMASKSTPAGRGNDKDECVLLGSLHYCTLAFVPKYLSMLQWYLHMPSCKNHTVENVSTIERATPLLTSVLDTRHVNRGGQISFWECTFGHSQNEKFFLRVYFSPYVETYGTPCTLPEWKSKICWWEVARLRVVGEVAWKVSWVMYIHTYGIRQSPSFCILFMLLWWATSTASLILLPVVNQPTRPKQ